MSKNLPKSSSGEESEDVPALTAPARWRLFFEGDDFFSSLREDLENARLSILIEMYIFEDGFVGNTIVEVLAERARSGVDVRLVVDGIGSLHLGEANLAFLREAGVLVRIFRPQTPLVILFHPDHRRDHRKLVVIDGRICYIGGMNITDRLSVRASGVSAWLDSMIRVEGELAIDAHRTFFRIWYYLNRKRLLLPALPVRSIPGEREFQIVENLPYRTRRKFRRLFRRSLLSAKSGIYIRSPYFIPRFFLLQILRKMADRGVEVIVLLNRTSDITAAKWAGRAIYAPLLRRGVRIFELEERFSHAKSIVVDGRLAILGSTNMDYRSFLHNLEIDLLCKRPDVAGELRRKFFEDLKLAHEVLPAEWHRRSRFRRLLERFFYMFRYWL